MSFFPELHTHSKNKIEVELDVSSYACVDTYTVRNYSS